jgi:hypothetical protein
MLWHTAVPSWNVTRVLNRFGGRLLLAHHFVVVVVVAWLLLLLVLLLLLASFGSGATGNFKVSLGVGRIHLHLN